MNIKQSNLKHDSITNNSSTLIQLYRLRLLFPRKIYLKSLIFCCQSWDYICKPNCKMSSLNNHHALNLTEWFNRATLPTAEYSCIVFDLIYLFLSFSFLRFVDEFCYRWEQNETVSVYCFFEDVGNHTKTINQDDQ